MSAEFADILISRLRRVCELDREILARLEAHYRMLLRWNRVMNLTSVREPHQIVERHYCESLFLGLHLPAGPASVADIGSGAGFPGVPVAVLRPDLAVTVIEAHQRKAVFLRESTRGFTNVRVIAGRAESIIERFDWTVSRGVRYSEIAGTLARLAPQSALLTGDLSDAELPRFVWTRVIPLPWGDRRFVRIGRVA